MLRERASEWCFRCNNRKASGWSSCGLKIEKYFKAAASVWLGFFFFIFGLCNAKNSFNVMNSQSGFQWTASTTANCLKNFSFICFRTIPISLALFCVPLFVRRNRPKLIIVDFVVVALDHKKPFWQGNVWLLMWIRSIANAQFHYGINALLRCVIDTNSIFWCGLLRKKCSITVAAAIFQLN